MIEDPSKPDTLEATARDYLGQPSPLAFKNQPALPSGGGSIGVGAGPNTSAAGTGAGSVKRSAAFQEMLNSLQLPDPAAGGGADGGDPGAGAPTEGNVTGFDSGLVGTGLTAAGLAAGVPGAISALGAVAPGIAAGTTSVPGLGSAFSLGKLANSLLGNYSNLATPSGAPVAALRTGLIDTIAASAQGKSNFATSSDPTVAAMIAQNPALLSDPAFMAAPLGEGKTVSDTISPVDNALSPGVSMNPGTFGATNMPGQVGFAGAPGGPNMAQGGTGAPSGGGDYGGYGGKSGDPSAPGAISFGQGRGDTPDGTGTGGGGSGGTFLCTALHKRGLMDDATLDANHRFARTMTRAEYLGYARWAKPLTAWADRHPLGARALIATLGWAPRAYMKEISAPGSSLIGRVLLYAGLKVCARLGQPTTRRAHA